MLTNFRKHIFWMLALFVACAMSTYCLQHQFATFSKESPKRIDAQCSKSGSTQQLNILNQTSPEKDQIEDLDTETEAELGCIQFNAANLILELANHRLVVQSPELLFSGVRVPLYDLYCNWKLHLLS
ncbi:MAG: hypothetical protein CFE24_07655 [Flavobacterium sp. BFFFF2]|nr:MAG: hypothetical protein CFE24_07655 [Flavobacterium sp. BFFFF2]